LKECCVCFEETAVPELRLLAPCGHRCVCTACAALLLQRLPERRSCPLCGEAVASATRVWDM
jgi:hypothetical protein